MQAMVITRAKAVKRKDIIESKAPNKGNNICMIGKWLARIMEVYSPSSLRAAVGCVAIPSNILRLLRQLLRNFLAMTIWYRIT